MTRIARMSSFVFALFCILTPAKYYAQAALQEIVRFNIPVGEHSSFHAETGGDISGDGGPDLVYSCIDEMNYSNCPVYIYYSIPDSNAVPDQILTTPNPYESGFGYSIAYKGDLNGDDISDLAVGVRYYGWEYAGGVFVYFGGDPPFTVPDVIISGVGLGYTLDWCLFFGEDMITDCDLNGDGVNDLLVFAPGPQYEEWGNVYAFLGGVPFNTTPALHIRGAVPYERLGADMKTGDINGDGYDDIVLTNRVPVNPGELYGPCHYHLKIYSGGENLTNVPIFETLLASAPAAGIGGIIVNGDLNGDGYDNILISGGSQTDPSWLKVFYGQDDLTSLQSVDFDLGYNHYTIKSYVNLNNDPFSDLWVKLHRPMPYDPYEGSYAVYKQISEVLDLIPDYVDPSPDPRPSYGYCYPLGDMNNDGSSDFFVYAYPTINPPCLAYATILSESYVSNSDECTQPARVMINCYPNPFSTTTCFTASTNKTLKAGELLVYNVRGQLLRKLYVEDGAESIFWDGLTKEDQSAAPGIYLCRYVGSSGSVATVRILKTK